MLLLGVAMVVRYWHDRRQISAAPAADLADLQRRAEADPSGEQAQLALGIGLERAGKLGEARQALLAADRAAPADPKPPLWLGMVAIEAKNFPQAERELVEALRRDPGNTDASRALGQLYLRDGRDAQAVPLLERAAAAQPNDAAAWRLLGSAEFRLRQLSRGRESLQRAVKLDPGDATALASLAESDLLLGLLEEARASYAAALKLRPDDADALTGMAEVSVQLDPSPNGLAAASEPLDRAMRANPTPRAYLVRGHIHLLRQEYPAAEADLKQALAGSPTLAEADGYLSQVYAQTGRPEEARRAVASYERAAAARKAPAATAPR